MLLSNDICVPIPVTIDLYHHQQTVYDGIYETENYPFVVYGNALGVYMLFECYETLDMPQNIFIKIVYCKCPPFQKNIKRNKTVYPIKNISVWKMGKRENNIFSWISL